MTDAQARNERIASWFEPKPVPLSTEGTHGWLSPKKFWVNSQHSDHHQWKSHYDFDTDESANAMLLEAMGDSFYLHCYKSVGAGILWESKVGNHMWTRDPDRKRAVWLAFFKFAGIELEK